MRSGPYTARMTRVSPPELERELPGPQASTSVTFAPACRRCSAVQPPKAPAPMTVMRGLEEEAKKVLRLIRGSLRGIRQASSHRAGLLTFRSRQIAIRAARNGQGDGGVFFANCWTARMRALIVA